MDFNSAITINLQSQIINLIADPIFMKFFGVNGAAIASTVSDIYCTIGYYFILKKKNMLHYKINNFYKNISYLVKNGIFVQIKNICNNLTYFFINKRTIMLDNSGIVSAVHILSCKILEMLSILYISLGSVSTILIPKYKSDLVLTKITINRILFWGIIISFSQGTIAYIFRPLLTGFTKDLNVYNQLIKILPCILLFSGLSGISSIIDCILLKEYQLQSIGSIFTLIIIFFTINYCNSLNQIWILIILISSLRIPIN